MTAEEYYKSDEYSLPITDYDLVIDQANKLKEDFRFNDKSDVFAFAEAYHQAKQKFQLSDFLKPKEIRGPVFFHCPNCNQPWDIEQTNSCQCGASSNK